MSVAPELVHLVRLWVKKAENDLRNAEHTLTMGDDCPFDTVCFHAQQCAEKYIKALLTYFQVDFGRTHDIGNLTALLPAHVEVPLTPTERELLTRYATRTRYPGQWEPDTRDEAEQAVNCARRVREAVLQHLGPLLNSPENPTT